MILKITMPYLDRSVEGGTVIRWHKAEGEMVNPGDELFDLQIDEKRLLRQSRKAQAILESSQRKNKQSESAKSTKGGATLQVVSSDAGFLRKVYASPGTRLAVGDLAAAVTTEAQEPWNENHQAVTEASEFRVVASITW